uniref:Uncharacterized protein n=1 Tax=Anguilla anguilla TaxID=7936 RepID=A0A0E9S0D1_ANGAN
MISPYCCDVGKPYIFIVYRTMRPVDGDKTVAPDMTYATGIQA